MCRNWKKVSALGLAVLIGCMLPMGTMLAAEENAGTVQENEAKADSDSDAFQDDKTISEEEKKDDENHTDKGKTDSHENDIDKEKTDSHENDAEEEKTDENDADDEGDIVDEVKENQDEADNANITPPIRQKAPAKAAKSPESIEALEIEITSEGKSLTSDLGGEITYEHVNHTGRSFNVSVTQGDQSISYDVYLEKNSGKESLGKEQLASYTWIEDVSSTEGFPLSEDGSYVLYVKAGEGENVIYKRSGGIVVDTKAPVISGVEDGKTYQEGTEFQVEDVNLESIFVNDQPVALKEDGKYQVTAKDNSTSCVIKAKDKAGNETNCSITVSGKSLEGDTISGSGTYSLKANTPYKLGGGNWSVQGSKTVYRGGSTFYVKTDGDYTFWKHIFE